ncbi:MAG: molybdopterin-synthase adenylyltransferase MoeB [Anaerolineales bacterium]|nr:molybdopterin-synthase adenylyltransferase MoeB [Anaerolineales bacterium]MCB9127448.1 molybdopterin-synthase adenylyltransferase MoeB [Ardenticatenales bacterium]MCB9172219.1 molybdopterin-synthase adenylyltransferase MoeB [Ardenticatenales bacterium]
MHNLSQSPVPEIDAAQLSRELAVWHLIDVREPEEWAQGHLAEATHIPLGQLARTVETVGLSHDRPIALYCATGVRSVLAGQTLQSLGYRHVVSLRGGVVAWQHAALPLVSPWPFSAMQRERYDRHLRLRHVGAEGQAKLLHAKVLIVGAGGLGSPAALYLAAAGVGTIGIIDHDRVERSNLQRQILHREATVGQPKVDSAAAAISALNPDVTVVAYHRALTADNALEIIADYDVIINGCDNFPTRYLLSDACVLTGKPLVDGSIYQFEGQVTLYNYEGGPTYRSLFPTPPPAGAVPNCAEGGVLGVLAGVIGTLQALEAIKLILGIGDPLSGRLLLFDALTTEFREVAIRKADDEPPITALTDYEAFCR